MGSLQVWGVALALVMAIVCSAPGSLIGAQAGTGAIGGRVHVVSHPARRLATAGAYPGRTIGIQVERDASELENVIVFLNTPAGTDSPPTRVSIRQSGEEFIPHVVAVSVGSTVDFPNDDLIFHNVFSLSRAGTFDLGRYPRGASRLRTFSRPGIVKVFCHFHAHMSAIVRVFPHPYFAIPDRDGRFRISDVPMGRYDVTAWHERAGDVTHTATIGDEEAAELTFSLPLTDPE